MENLHVEEKYCVDYFNEIFCNFTNEGFEELFRKLKI